MDEVKISTPTQTTTPGTPLQNDLTSPGVDPSEQIDKMRRENDALEKELLRQEKLKQQLLISGKSLLQPNVEKTEEQRRKENAMDFWRGTGIDKAIAQYG